MRNLKLFENYEKEEEIFDNIEIGNYFTSFRQHFIYVVLWKGVYRDLYGYEDLTLMATELELYKNIPKGILSRLKSIKEYDDTYDLLSKYSYISISPEDVTFFSKSLKELNIHIDSTKYNL